MSRATGLITQKNYRILLYVYSLVIVLLGASFAGLGVIWSLPGNLGEGYHNVQAMLRGIQQVLFFRITLFYSIAILIIVVAMVVLHLLYSHRIAGPAYRIGQEAAKIALGNLAGIIKFRKHDNLMDMADSMNDVASQYREHIGAVLEHLASIEELSLKMSVLAQQGNDDNALKQAAEEMSRKSNAIDDCLAEIRT
ncbi:MAG: methyl-accepting chemotaxis protein [Geobacteraceae bacterium]|nr:methyl-accepting chemotaxis protein [Geobacteraceae bacterium]NTW79813.1 methyl-accepting chemotaxis protein [Geobacteraceae bacterium]